MIVVRIISLKASEGLEVNSTLPNVDVGGNNIDNGVRHLNGFKVAP